MKRLFTAFTILFLTYFFTLSLFSQEKTSLQELQKTYEMNSLNNDSSLFAYAKQKTVIVINTEDLQTRCQFKTKSEIQKLQFQSSKDQASNMLFVVLNDGTLYYYDVQNQKVLWQASDFPGEAITASAFNYSGNYILTGYNSGKICLYSQMAPAPIFNKMIISEAEPLTTASIQFLDISYDNKFLLLGDAEGKLIVWNFETQTEQSRFDYDPLIAKNAFFTGENNNIIILVDSITAGIFDLNGQIIQKIQLENEVKQLFVSADGKTVTINEVEQVIKIEENEEPEQELKGKIETVLRYKNVDNFEANLKFSLASKPYSIGLDLNAGYLVYKVLQPFYFGGFLDFGLSFPGKEFPYIYQIGTGALPNPKLFTVKSYGTAGICIYPFTELIEVFADISLGYTGAFLWNMKFGMYNVSSGWFSSLFTAVRLGAGYHGFKGFLEFDYEPLFGINLGLGAGYEVKIKS